VNSSDVVIAGAGIIGLSLAVELRRIGASVAVLERGEPGREASSAAAGMLVTGDPDTNSCLRPLIEASARMYPAFVDDLELRSGMTVNFDNRGALYVASDHESVPFPALTSAEVRELEPALADFPRVHLLEESSVDPRLLVQAALVAAKNMGVVVHHEAAVQQIRIGKQRDLEIESAAGPYQTATFVNCTGAWAREIAGSSAPSRPIKGQMLAVIPHGCELRHVVRSRDVYLVPRRDGRVLIGATVEEAGFDKRVNPDVIQRLHQAAANLVPRIGEARILEAWAGLRPGSPDGLPILGPGRLPGSYVATGHFRNGILLAPITATVMAELIQGRKPQVDLGPFAPSRFADSNALAG